MTQLCHFTFNYGLLLLLMQTSLPLSKPLKTSNATLT